MVEPNAAFDKENELPATASKSLDVSFIDLMKPTTSVDDDGKNLHVDVYKDFLSPSSNFYEQILNETEWFRVKYKSARYGNDCETPCYTNFYGGVVSEESGKDGVAGAKR